jgi:hypothetical protein
MTAAATAAARTPPVTPDGRQQWLQTHRLEPQVRFFFFQLILIFFNCLMFYLVFLPPPNIN